MKNKLMIGVSIRFGVCGLLHHPAYCNVYCKIEKGSLNGCKQAQ